jgi:hypothetical protein
MGILRSVGGWGEVDLDQRAITTEDDIVDLSELDRSHDQPNQPAPVTQNAAAAHDEPSEGQPRAAAIPANRTPCEAPLATDAPGPDSDEDFDRWVADRAPGLGSAVAASKPSTPPPASDARELTSGAAPTAASGTAGVPRDEPTVPAVTSPRGRLLRSGPLSLPRGRLARPAAAMTALALAVGGTAIAINAAATSGPHQRPESSTTNARVATGQNNPLGDALNGATAAVAPELRALARAASPTHRASHPPRRRRRRHPSRHLPVQKHPAAGSERSTARQTSPITTPAPQTQNYTPPATSAASSTSHTSTGSPTSSSQLAGPTRSSPLGGIGSCVSGCS